MARALRPLLLVVLLTLGAASSASAASLYDPDGLSFGGTPSADVTISSGTCLFNTDTGAMTGSCARAAGLGDLDSGIGATTVSGAEFGEIATEFVFNSLTLDNGATITPIGTHDLVIATRNDMDIQGTVNLNGIRGTGVGLGDHAPSTPCGGAGGGAGYGGLGGESGEGTAGGGSYGSADLSSDLLHGSPGGESAHPSCGTFPEGGGGGGAVGLVALGSLSVGGLVTANGAPPHGGSPFSDQGGPGGGSGGAILLMSPDLSLANQSVVSAAGGAGGSTTLDAGNGGGGGGGGRISLASTLSMSDVSFTATMPGFGGSGGSSGAAGHNGDGGSIDAEPFMTMTGPSSRQAGQSASFSASPAAGDASFAWDFGDGTSDTVQSPNHIFTVPGTYNVTVTATLTDSGKTATAHRSITITAPPSTGGGGGGAGGGGGNPQPQPPTPPQSRPQCVVPKLKGLSLSAARKKLTRAHCKLGKVKKPKLRKGTKKKPHLVVVKQPAANKAFPAGTKVNVTLGPKRPKRHHH